MRWNDGQTLVIVEAVLQLKTSPLLIQSRNIHSL